MRVFLRHGHFARLRLAIHHDLLGLGGIGDHLERVADFRQRLQTQHFDRHRGLGFAHRLAAVVEHRADFAEHRSADEIIADAQRAVAAPAPWPPDRARDRASLRARCPWRAARDWPSDPACRPTSRIISSSRSRFGLGPGRNRNHDDVAAPVLGQQAAIGQLLLDPLRLRVGLSILLIATMIGTFAALAWSMASSVCGITPSSAATTSTTMSVTLAPRARMRVNASWPGVSMNTILRPFFST